MKQADVPALAIAPMAVRRSLATADSDCIVVAVSGGGGLSKQAAALDRYGEITEAVASGDISGEPGSTLLLRNLRGARAARVLLAGFGSGPSIAEKDFIGALRRIAGCLAALGARRVLLALPIRQVTGRGPDWAIRLIVQSVHDAWLGTAYVLAGGHGATGRPVSLLATFLINRARRASRL
ncbi:M17 family peptidase N-terminal domain-containing protein [Massilia cavernae]|uniref:Peptidase M17 leucyl aminopeptidase N-terminal domain-containing protein n=1 Tax=Massilia cavernae TaxID=2320864 RepID=A0A418XQU9_9BURK|nr:M17 family peptidase N-terminal domain-containing protein [Massilia cavernae]RJG14874.1 hypothetical protein D3872_15785 [Massilia cavernae]